MTQSKEVCELIGNKMISCRWDINAECCIKFELLSNARESLINDITSVSNSEAQISTTTHKMYYLCNQECFELLENQYLFKINDKKLNNEHIQLLNNLSALNLQQLLSKFKRNMLLKNNQHLEENIINSLIRMLQRSHVTSSKAAATDRINECKRSLMQSEGSVHVINDALFSFNLKNKSVVHVYFTVNIINLSTGISSGCTSVLDCMLNLDHKGKLIELSKHSKFDPDQINKIESKFRLMDNDCKRLFKKQQEKLTMLMYVYMNQCDVYFDELEEDAPIGLQSLTYKARARHEKKHKCGIYCNVCGNKNDTGLWLMCNKHGMMHYKCNKSYASFCCPWC